MDKIALIKAEIERLKGQTPYPCPGFLEEYNMGYFDAMDSILSFLDALESEKPMQEDLEKEIDRVVKEYSDKVQGTRVMKPSGVARLARHFAEWGTEHLKK